jgi:hypothetical protein
VTVYTILPEDDLNLEVTVTDPNDPRISILDDLNQNVTVTEEVVVLNITPASVNVTSAVTSVNGLVGNVTLTTTEIPQGTNLYYTDALADARVDLQTGANLDLSFMDTDDLAEGPTNLYSKQPNAITDDVTFNSVTADMFGVQHFVAKAREAISAGQPVYISGHSGNTPEVMVADFDDPTKMPAFGIASADIQNNNNGSISTYGDLKNVDTTGTAEGETWAVGDELFVNGSKLTNVRPDSETEEVQKIAKIIRVHANVGQMFLMGAGRSNDTPNLDHYHVFIGNAGGVEQRQLTYTDILNTPNLSNFITASSTDTLTNKSGAISQWTNDAGYITSETDNQTLAFTTPNLSISNGNSVDLTTLTTGFITASSTDTFTNKSGSNSQWTNDEAYLKANALTPYYTSTQVDALPVSTFTNDAGYLTTETDSQTLSFTSPNLTISNGNTVDIGSLEVDTIDGGTY